MHWRAPLHLFRINFLFRHLQILALATTARLDASAGRRKRYTICAACFNMLEIPCCQTSLRMEITPSELLSMVTFNRKDIGIEVHWSLKSHSEDLCQLPVPSLLLSQ